MEILFLIIPLGVFFSLIAFSLFEFRAIKANKQAAFVSGEIPQYSINDKFKRYDTMNNTGLFAIAVYVLTLIMALIFHSDTYGLIHVLLYIFCTTFIGSAIIFVIKIKRSVLVKVFAAFLYGVAHMIGSALAFLTSYLIA